MTELPRRPSFLFVCLVFLYFQYHSKSKRWFLQNVHIVFTSLFPLPGISDHIQDLYSGLQQAPRFAV